MKRQLAAFRLLLRLARVSLDLNLKDSTYHLRIKFMTIQLRSLEIMFRLPSDLTE
jgi:hypothetical protein